MESSQDRHLHFRRRCRAALLPHRRWRQNSKHLPAGNIRSRRDTRRAALKPPSSNCRPSAPPPRLFPARHYFYEHASELVDLPAMRRQRSIVRNGRRRVKPYIIVNRRAGSVADLDGLLSQLQRLEPAALRVTRRRGDAEKFAREAVRKRCDYVVAAGGDGTLNEVINGIAEHPRELCLGLVPLGTGNDFARSLKLPLTVDANIDILLSQKSMAIDLVRIRSDHI